MKLISWNVNGIRACLKKGFPNYFLVEDADIFCIQETKLQQGMIPFKVDGYYSYWNYADRKGYSGTAVLTKIKPLDVQYGIGMDKHDHEGRVITLEFNNFYLVTVYTPNSKRDLERLQYRTIWEQDFLSYVSGLDKKKPVVICGDLNVAHCPIDLYYPDSNTRSAGFTMVERQCFTNLLNAGFIDTYRYKNPDKANAYSWWSYMHNSRARNIGWRIDYFLISERLKDNLKDVTIRNNIYGSDHCPVGIILGDDLL